MSKYGLLGEKLSHSFSKIIHEKLNQYSYDLMPMNAEELHSFLNARDFNGVNVTIPYKQEVIPFCDEIDDTAKRIGAVNTIVNRNGKLIGYNTDFNGFLFMLRKNHIDVKNKIVYILGSGGTSKTVKAVLEYLNAKEIVIVSRIASESKITYTKALQRKDANIIVNTSPKGMYPNNQDLPIDISEFENITAVVDVIYNPLNTRLLQQAKKKNITYVNGLYMLVAQAIFAAEYFLNEKIVESEIDRIYQDILCDLQNIIIVGMPSAGKSTIGKAISKLLNRQFVDIDSLIEKETQMSIPQIFEQQGESYFRNLEHDAIEKVAKQTGIVIATGGGALLNSENILNLRQNGVIVFIDRPLDALLVGGHRPLSKSKEAIEKLYHERYPIYLASCDFVVQNNGDLQQAISLVKENFYATIRSNEKQKQNEIM